MEDDQEKLSEILVLHGPGSNKRFTEIAKNAYLLSLPPGKQVVEEALIKKVFD